MPASEVHPLAHQWKISHGVDEHPMVLGSALCDPSEAGLQNVVAVEKGHL